MESGYNRPPDSRSSSRTGITHDEHIVGCNIEIWIINTVGKVFYRLKDDSPSRVNQQFFSTGRLLDDGAVTGKVAAKNSNRTTKVNRVIKRPNNILQERLRQIFDLLPQCATGDGRTLPD